tara:strand:- start:1156 stop:1461 length:306 start_codon:yes stop_codon:yes gene_type:complete
METFGGMFWDCLLLCEYNGFTEFYLSMAAVVPCEKCRIDNMLYLSKNKIPTFNSNKEKNEWLWEHRLNRGGPIWRNKVEENNYNLNSWLDLYKNKVFTIHK